MRSEYLQNEPQHALAGQYQLQTMSYRESFGDGGVVAQNVVSGLKVYEDGMLSS